MQGSIGKQIFSLLSHAVAIFQRYCESLDYEFYYRVVETYLGNTWAQFKKPTIIKLINRMVINVFVRERIITLEHIYGLISKVVKYSGARFCTLYVNVALNEMNSKFSYLRYEAGVAKIAK